MTTQNTLDTCGRSRNGGGCAPVDSERMEFPASQVVELAKASPKAFSLPLALVPETRQ